MSVKCQEAASSLSHSESHDFHFLLPFVTAAPSFVAAIQRGRPPDWTHHTEQEVSCAPWGRLTLGSKSKQGALPIHTHIINFNIQSKPEKIPFNMVVSTSLCRWWGGRWQRRGDLGLSLLKSKRAAWPMWWDTSEQVQIEPLTSTYWSKLTFWRLNWNVVLSMLKGIEEKLATLAKTCSFNCFPCCKGSDFSSSYVLQLQG